MKSILILLLMMPAAFGFAAQEKLGQIEVSQVLLRPKLLFVEPFHGEFNLGESSFSVEWSKGESLSAQFSVGPDSLKNTSARYIDSISNELSVYEAYAQFSGVYGEFRMGLIPISFGYEGSLREFQLGFSRHLLYSERVLSLRDLGLSYSIDHNGYFTSLFVHNGESGENIDGRIWYTANWGWEDHKYLKLGFSGQTGTTKPDSTSASLDTLAGVNVNSEAQWYVSNLFFHWYPNKWEFNLEAYAGELNQEAKPKDIKEKFYGGYVDVNYQFNPTVKLMLRYDQFEPNEGLKNDLMREYSLGFAFYSLHKSSIFFIQGTKVVEENAKVTNDELRFIWQLNPLLL